MYPAKRYGYFLFGFRKHCHSELKQKSLKVFKGYCWSVCIILLNHDFNNAFFLKERILAWVVEVGKVLKGWTE